MKKRQRLGTVAVGMACAFFVTSLASCDWFKTEHWEKDGFFDEAWLNTNHAENLSRPEYTDGYCNGRIFCSTVESEEYFQSYAQSVYDYLWEKGLYLGQLGEVVDGIGWIFNYEFVVDVEPRILEKETVYEFFYTENANLNFPESATAESGGSVVQDSSSKPLYYYDNMGELTNVRVISLNYYEVMQTMNGEGDNIPCDYNFKMWFPSSGIFNKFYADVDRWNEMIDGRIEQ